MSRSLPGVGAGYTLIELIVALALMALASLLIVEGIRFGNRAWDAVSRHLSRVDDIALAQHVLRDRLSQTYPARPENQGGQTRFAIEGGSDELTFSAPAVHAQTAGLLRYRVYWDHGSAARALKISWQRDDDGSASAVDLNGWHDEVLLKDVDAASFEYFERGENRTGHWVPTWLHQAKLPPLVRIKVTPSGRGDDWPDLVVRLRLDAPADCGFDAVSRQCR
jgi:prepilin-type N-terminal cleavage/methylation domain-containing protein